MGDEDWTPTFEPATAMCPRCGWPLPDEEAELRHRDAMNLAEARAALAELEAEVRRLVEIVGLGVAGWKPEQQYLAFGKESRTIGQYPRIAALLDAT